MKTIVHKLAFYIDAFSLFSLYSALPDSVFLDSSLSDDQGRYSIIGLNPYLCLEETDGRCFQNKTPVTLSLEQALSLELEHQKEEHRFPLPLIAGAIGYFSYDYGRKFESIQSRHKKESAMPDARFLFYDNLIIEDKKEKTLYLTARGALMPAASSLAALEKQIEEYKAHSFVSAKEPPVSSSGSPFLNQASSLTSLSWYADFTREEYLKAVTRMIQYIIEGDIYIANMTQQLFVPSETPPYAVFQALRTKNPSPFGAYLNYDSFQIISASPERFLHLQNQTLETRPIKGTRPRGTDPQTDAAFRNELIHSEKDRSELLMIVDLERNDFNKVCLPGSVQVPEHFSLETYATVFHLVSTVTGLLPPDCRVSDLISATFPGGSITGTPKIRAMEIIDELEHHRRGLYTGSIGYFSLDGNCDFNIVIRTAVYEKGTYTIGVGGGITCESDPEAEYEETLQKARAVLKAIEDGRNFI